MSFSDWKNLIKDVIIEHYPVITPGGFLVINIADILAFYDSSMPRIQADNVSSKKIRLTREEVLSAQTSHPGFSRYQLAKLLQCSEQTIQRRLENNNVRGGKYKVQTRVLLVASLIEEWAAAAGFYLYDRRIWVKDPCWENSRWHSLSYRSVDESEYIYVLWKPGITNIDRSRISKKEWGEWGSRGVWTIPSVRANDVHEAQFPLEIARRVVRLFSSAGDVVLDCFIGSGTTAIAAIRENRQFIGFELLPHYAALAAERCEKARKEMHDFRPPQPSR